MSNALEVPWVEGYVLGDKQRELDKLIPGTEDHFYYSIIHYLNTNQINEANLLLENYAKLFRGPKLQEVTFRTLLVKYAETKASDAKENLLVELKKLLSVEYTHRRFPEKKNIIEASSSKEKEIPSRLTSNSYNFNVFDAAACVVEDLSIPAMISKGKIFAQNDLISYFNNGYLAGFSGAEGLLVTILGDPKAQVRNLKLGSILRQFTKSQLDKLRSSYPKIYDNPEFLLSYASKLKPSNLDPHSQSRKNYLEELLKFSKNVSPVNISFKFNVVHYLLRWEIENSTVMNVSESAKDLFLDYVQLSRYGPNFVLKQSNPSPVVYNCGDLSLPGIGSVSQSDDEQLISKYLKIHFSNSEGNSFKPFDLYFTSNFLNEIMGEAKITSKIGNLDSWYSLISPYKAKELQESVKIEFLECNKKYFDVDENISLHLRLKNIQKLIVKIFEISTTNFYLLNRKEIETDISLDGLISKEEATYQYNHSPTHVFIENFNFPTIKGRGVFVIEFIGNGISSRALIRKGKLVVSEQMGENGHIFTFFDEKYNQLSDVSINFGSNYYITDQNAEITIPFQLTASKEFMVITHQNFSVFESFQIEQESYSLFAGISLDRESLLPSSSAAILIRPKIFLANRVPIDLERVKNYSLFITTLLNGGISLEKELSQSDFIIEKGQQLIYLNNLIPSNCRSITIRLSLTVQNITRNLPVSLSSSATYNINSSLDSSEIASSYLVPGVENGKKSFKIFIAGRCGEPQPGTLCKVSLKHKLFKSPLEFKLKSDEDSFIHLGELNSIEYVRHESITWNIPSLSSSSVFYPTSLNLSNTDNFILPFYSTAPEEIESIISLHSVTPDYQTIIEDYSNKFLSCKSGVLKIKKKLPVGDYLLTFKYPFHTITLKVEDRIGKDLIFGKSRILHKSNFSPVTITDISEKSLKKVDNGVKLTVQLKNSNPSTLVCVVLNQFLPSNYTGTQLNCHLPISSNSLYPASQLSQYVSGRELGDENRYIFDRKYLPQFMGSFLQPPTLQINSFVTRTVGESSGFAKGGDNYAAKGGGSNQLTQINQVRKGSNLDHLTDDKCMDFLKYPSIVLVGKLDKKGVAEFTLKNIDRFGSFVQIVALNENSISYKNYILSKKYQIPLREVLLTEKKALEHDSHYVQRSQVSVIYPPNIFTSNSSSNFNAEVYDTLAKVSLLFTRITSEETLFGEFKDLLIWPTFTPDQKKNFYLTHGSNELNFFTYMKDKEFFNSVVLPFIKEKPYKSFLDNFFLDLPLSSYLQSWSFNQLNIFEQILLCWKTNKLENLIINLRNSLVNRNQKHEETLFEKALHISSSQVEAVSVLNCRRASKKDQELRSSMDFSFSRRTSVKKIGKMKKRMSSVERCASVSDESDDDVSRSESDPETENNCDASKPTNSYLKFKKSVNAKKLIAEKGRINTEERIEQEYYKQQQRSERIHRGIFWLDFAEHLLNSKIGENKLFLPTHIELAGTTCSELVIALSTVDLPFTKSTIDIEFHLNGGISSVKGDVPFIVYHKDILKVQDIETSPVMITECFFDVDNKYIHVNGERQEVFCEANHEFLVSKVYGAKVIITNATDITQHYEILSQIPVGSVPVSQTQQTQNRSFMLNPYFTLTFEYFFYFPFPGQFAQFPSHLSKNGKILAHGKPHFFHVTKTPKFETKTWANLVIAGTDDEVLAELKNISFGNLNFADIAHRLKNKAFYLAVIKILTDRLYYNELVWSYSFYHTDQESIKEYLQNSQKALSLLRSNYINNSLFSYDPMESYVYVHKEYSPIIDARIHQFGANRKLLNDGLRSQYIALLNTLSYKPKLTNNDYLEIIYYLLLMNRVAEAIKFFSLIDENEFVSSPASPRLIFYYYKSYLLFRQNNLPEAKAIAEKFINTEISHIRSRFQEILDHISSLENKTFSITKVSKTKIERKIDGFKYKVVGEKINIEYADIDYINVSYYPIDIELLFSNSPFFSVDSKITQFAYIKPNASEKLVLPSNASTLQYEINKEYQFTNVMIELKSGAIQKYIPHYSHSMKVRIASDLGKLQVVQKKSGAPLSRVYVKVYGSTNGKTGTFYKDGYTDLLGIFDFLSNSNFNQLSSFKYLSILLTSESNGSVVKCLNVN